MTSTRGYSETELKLLTMRQGGIDPVDRNGRPRIPLGSGFESQLVRATYRLRQPRAPYESRVLTNEDCTRLYKGVAVANLAGLILNTFVTVSWELTGLSGGSSIRKQQGSFQERIAKWFAYRREQEPRFPRYAGIWVNEVGKTLGQHTHYLLHVPPTHYQLFRHWVARSVAKATVSTRSSLGMTAKGKPLYVTDMKDLGYDTDAQWRVFRYMTKGLDPEELVSVFRERRHMLASEYAGLSVLTDEGLIEGKRCGRSRAISEAAFEAWRNVYNDVMKSAWRSAGPGSLDYGNSFVIRGHILGLGI